MNFEYKVFNFDRKSGFFSQKIKTDLLQQQLNKLGQSGWEVVSSSNAGSQIQTSLVIILKRAK